MAGAWKLNRRRRQLGITLNKSVYYCRFRETGKKMSALFKFSVRFRLAVLLAILLSLSILSAGCQKEEVDISEGVERRFEVGFNQIDLIFKGSDSDEETLETAIWYPTISKPEAYIYENRVVSRIAPDGQPDKENGPFPLIFFNHGFNAKQFEPLYLKEYLASEGYIVVSPHYNDSILAGISTIFDISIPVGFDDESANNSGYVANLYRNSYISYLDKYRLSQSSFVLDEILKLSRDSTSVLHDLIAGDAIGMAGHSLGGLTTLGLIGGHPDEMMRNDGIKVALLLGSPVYPFENNLERVDIPIMSMEGDYDILANKPDNQLWCFCDELSIASYHLVLKESYHFTFSGSPCSNQVSVPLCQQEQPQVRVINEYALAFFNFYLKNDVTAGSTLKSSNNALAEYKIYNHE
jgi:hypothetical protein